MGASSLSVFRSFSLSRTTHALPEIYGQSSGYRADRSLHTGGMPLISASDLLARRDSILLVDARQEAAGYEAGHLPGAIHADLNRHLSTACDPGHDPARGGRHPLPPIARFAAQVGAWGIVPDTEVVVYDASGGSNAAARLWWMLRALGHERVRVLDGGLQAAVGAGMMLTVE